MFKRSRNRGAMKRIGPKQQAAKTPCQDYFDTTQHNRTYCCRWCLAHLANDDDIISKLFQGQAGRAYLFNKVVNIGCKQAVERELLTGRHSVSDVYCISCQTNLGWRYEKAFVESQKYKENKIIIELAHMLKINNWDLNSYNAHQLLAEEIGGDAADDDDGESDYYADGDANGYAQNDINNKTKQKVLGGNYSKNETNFIRTTRHNNNNNITNIQVQTQTASNRTYQMQSHCNVNTTTTTTTTNNSDDNQSASSQSADAANCSPSSSSSSSQSLDNSIHQMNE